MLSAYKTGALLLATCLLLAHSARADNASERKHILGIIEDPQGTRVQKVAELNDALRNLPPDASSALHSTY